MDFFDFLHGVRGQQVETTDGVEFLKNDYFSEIWDNRSQKRPEN